jgi:large subunit ribosomal protein L25
VIYGGGSDPEAFSVNARVLRNTLAHAHAVIEVSVDGEKAVPAMVKEIQRHPVRDEYVHIDLLRVRLDQPIAATVTLELTGTEKAKGVSAGGVLTHEAHQVQVEALPTDIPDSIVFDVSELELNATATIAQVTAPKGVKFLDDPDTVIATITPPSVEEAPEEVEQETEVVGEAEKEAAAAESEAAEE